MNDEFENALAWFTSAPREWVDSGKRNLAAAAEWIWQVLQGDFYEGASTAQVATGTVISMIPFVDQLCDVRDLVANCKKINDEPNNKWNWILLVLTLIGLFPTLGSLVKGCLKVAFASLRKVGATSGLTPRLALNTDVAMSSLHRFLTRPEITKTIKALKWDNPYRTLSSEVTKLAEKLSISAVLSAFNEASKAAESLLTLVSKWGGPALSEKSTTVLRAIDLVRRTANQKIGVTVGEVQTFLRTLARRLEVDADMAHRAYLNSVNPHAFNRFTEAEEAAAFQRAKPNWVDKTKVPRFKRLTEAPAAKPGWPSPQCYETFHSMVARTLPPGTKLYRVVDPRSVDNSICWMTESEFKELRSKDDWRRRFAVWANWNSNGEFVTYVVPPGPGLNVWEGVAASQAMKGTDYVLEGGAHQIVVDPTHMDAAHISSREKTKWGYEDMGRTPSLVGVPVQRNNWKNE